MKRHQVYCDGCDAPEIVDVRERMRPEPVSRDRSPSWLCPLIRKKIADGELTAPDRRDDPSWENRARTTKARVLKDWELEGLVYPFIVRHHAGSSYLRDGREALVVEPYLADIENAIVATSAVAKVLGCNLTHSAISWWHPPKTVRLVITRPESHEEREARFAAHALLVSLQSRGLKLRKSGEDVIVSPEKELRVRDRKLLNKYREHLVAMVHAEALVERELKRARAMMMPEEEASRL